MSIELKSKVREQNTANVLAVLPGSDPRLSKEHVVFMAHLDHLGLADRRDATGDNIYNGAIDNASGALLCWQSRKQFRACPNVLSDRYCWLPSAQKNKACWVRVTWQLIRRFTQDTCPP